MVPQTPTADCDGSSFTPFCTVSTAVLTRLNGPDRLLLKKILSEPAQFVDDPSFKRRGVEKRLFGGLPVFAAADASNFLPPTPVVENPYANGGTPTLTTEQEQTLFRRLNYARRQAYLIIQKRQGRRLNSSTVRTLLAWAHRALEIRGEIVRFNLPLVLAMAKRTRLGFVDYNDLVSEGNMALLRSVEKFDCSRGFKFSTYACRAILKSFSRVAMRMARYRCRFALEFDPSLEKSDYVERKRQTNEDDCISELQTVLADNTAELSDIERTVIRERFALSNTGTPSPKTLEQVGRLIGVTKERVRQIQNKALNKIKLALEEGILAA